MFIRFTNLQNSFFDDFRRLQQAMDEALSDGMGSAGAIRSLPRGSFPPLNVVQTPTEVQIYVFVPGIDPKKLDVSIQQGLLTVAGVREIVRNEAATYYRQERFDGAFSRAISLGDDVDPDRVEAGYRDGIVQIKLHRRESAKPRQIQVN